MKNLKKVLALVMACAMLFTMSSFAFTDVAEDASYLEAVTMLSKLGIINGYEDGTFLPDNTITRAEAAKVLVCALNAAEQAEGMVEDNIFTDVPGSHWAAGYVNYAANFGIISGRGNGIFDPEAPVTYEEIVKMVVAMLGYTPVANIKGGYPTGYLYVANNMIKITKGATGVTGDAAKRWVVARLLFNSLETPIMEQELWSAADPTYIQGDDTLLKDYLEVTKVIGTVTDTFYSADTIDKEFQPVEIVATKIDGISMSELFDEDDDNEYDDYYYEIVADEDGVIEIDANGTGAENYLFYAVTAYVKDIDGEYKLIAVAPRDNKNSTLEIAFDEIDAGTYEAKGKGYIFEYFENIGDEDTVAAKVADDAAVIVNGEASSLAQFKKDVNGYTADDVDYVPVYGENCAIDGSMRLLDNDGNGYYDFIFIEKVDEDYAVKSINEKTFKITSKAGDTIKLDPEDEDKYISFIKDGAVASFEDIKEDDVISIVKLYDEETVIKVYISSETVEGRVTSVTDDLYKIAGTRYSKTTGCDEIIKGFTGTFYLNYNGKIAYAEGESVTGGNYAFILDVNTKEPMFGNICTYTVLMMNEKGEWIQAELAEKVSFYAWNEGEGEIKKTTIDTTTDDMLDIATASENWFGAENIADEDEDPIYKLSADTALYENRVVKYSLNSAGEISSITIPSVNVTEEEDFEVGEFNAGYDDDENAIAAEYDADRNRFKGNGKTAVAEKTVIFTVNNDTNSIADVKKKSEVSVATSEIFKDGEAYLGKAFDIADDVFGCMIITEAAAAIDPEAPLFVVKDIYEEYNEEDETYAIIEGYMNGEEVTLETIADTNLGTELVVTGILDSLYDDDEALAIEEGAVIEVAKNAAGLVTDINVVYAPGAGFFMTDADYDYADEDGIAYYAGYLIDAKLDGNYTKLGDAEGVVLTNEDGEIAEINVKNAKVVNVDLTNDRKTKFAVEDGVAEFLDTLIYTDKNRDELEKGEMAADEAEVCYAFAKVVDGYAIDVVVYTVVYTQAV